MATEKRTDQEILARMQDVADLDYFGFKKGVLLTFLDFENVKPYLNDDVTEEHWEEVRPKGTPAEQGADYLTFAVGKMEDERGISANRSVQKFAEWAWLDGEDDLAEEIDNEENYGWYGDQAVGLYVAHYGLGWPTGGGE